MTVSVHLRPKKALLLVVGASVFLYKGLTDHPQLPPASAMLAS